MDLGISGRSAIVCASSRGLGYACADALAREGVNVTINSRDAEALAVAAERLASRHGVEVSTVVGDITHPDTHAALLAACPAPDILVNNNGGPTPGRFADWDRDTWIAALDANMLAPIAMIRAVLPGMVERRFGRIVNVSSVGGHLGGAGQANYSAAKAGMIAFTKTAARELARNQITVNAVCPGFVETEMVGALSDEVKAAVLQNIPLGRFGTAEEIAACVRFLCTEGGFFTGSQLSPNGGQYM